MDDVRLEQSGALRRVRGVLVVVGLALICLLVLASRAGAAISVDASVQTHQSSPATTVSAGPLSTSSGNDLLVAFLSSDGGSQSGSQSFTSVSGGGLTWRLRQRTNAQAGTAEIWEATAPSALSNVTVTATRGSGSYTGSMVVVAFAGADTSVDGAVATGNGLNGQPTATLTTTRAGSWVWGVGDDWDNATPRTVGSGQTKVDEFLASSGDTFWVQRQNSLSGASNTAVTINDTAPSNDRWNLSTIEILSATSDTTKPTPPSSLSATPVNSNQVNLSWTASSDNIAVTGYTILRDGNPIGTTTGTSYSDASVSPATPYNYTVKAFDAAGNVSDPSSPAPATTPQASTSPPVISGITVTNVTQTSATISWTTDIPSSTQVLYGSTSSYTQSTSLWSAQVTSHSQTITGLSANTPYHFAVRSTGATSNTSTSPDNSLTTLSNTITLPDMQIQIPTNLMSIGTNSNGQPELRFTHITWDAGTGPIELDPNYNSSTGTAAFSQAIYRSTAAGAWTLDHRVPLPVTVPFDPPGDYQFPLDKFTLNAVNPDGSLGAVVSTSPKTDFCMAGDTYVGGVPNTPNQTYLPETNCQTPTSPLGWSVGWGDQYDLSDPGQPIPLAGVPDGTYILHAITDPYHVLSETDPTNDVTDTKLKIQGGTVTVLSQSSPATSPPTAAMISPADGGNVSGTVTLKAAAEATPPATVSSVQFLLDGIPVGNPVVGAPYNFDWTIGSTPLGNHTLAARVTDSNGNMATSPAITVNVQQGSTPPPPDTTPPTVSITNPTATQTVSGTAPVAATATDNVAVASLQFYLDGNALGNPVTTAPYAINWDTTAASNGSHTLTAKATDTSGNVGTSGPVTVVVQNPAPPAPCFVMQANVTAHGTNTVTTPSFHTAMADEELYAFVSADGPKNAGSQTATVSGAGLTWKLIKRANAQAGDSEIWQAHATNILPSATVTSTLGRSGYVQSLNVIAMEGVKGPGAAVAASGSTGAPSLNLTTAGPSSLIFAVGNDWDRAVARTLPAGWVMLDQWLNTSVGDTFWTQFTNSPTGAAGSVVSVGDSAPTNDRWNLAAVELLNDDS